VQLEDDNIVFKTWRSFNTADPLDAVIKFDEEIPLRIASGSADTLWEDRFEHGLVRLKIQSIALEDQPVVEEIVPIAKPTFQESRI